jgi:hypothetical protein
MIETLVLVGIGLWAVAAAMRPPRPRRRKFDINDFKVQ